MTQSVIPGYPAPAQAQHVAPVATQGYPGPAVAAPPAPAPQTYTVPGPQVAMPQATAPAPAPAPAPYYPPAAAPAPYYPPAAAIPDMGAAIAGAIGGDSTPTLDEDGVFTCVIDDMHIAASPVEHGKLTLKSYMTVKESTNPLVPVGSKRVYIEGANQAPNLARGRAHMLAVGGYANDAAFQASAAASGLNPMEALANFCRAASQSAGNPLIGRSVRVVCQRVTKTPNKGKNAGKQVTFTDRQWIPA